VNNATIKYLSSILKLPKRTKMKSISLAELEIFSFTTEDFLRFYFV